MWGGSGLSVLSLLLGRPKTAVEPFLEYRYLVSGNERSPTIHAMVGANVRRRCEREAWPVFRQRLVDHLWDRVISALQSDHGYRRYTDEHRGGATSELVTNDVLSYAEAHLRIRQRVGELLDRATSDVARQFRGRYQGMDRVEDAIASAASVTATNAVIEALRTPPNTGVLAEYERPVIARSAGEKVTADEGWAARPLADQLPDCAKRCHSAALHLVILVDALIGGRPWSHGVTDCAHVTNQHPPTERMETWLGRLWADFVDQLPTGKRRKLAQWYYRRLHFAVARAGEIPDDLTAPSHPGLGDVDPGALPTVDATSPPPEWTPPVRDLPQALRELFPRWLDRARRANPKTPARVMTLQQKRDLMWAVSELVHEVGLSLSTRLHLAFALEWYLFGSRCAVAGLDSASRELREKNRPPLADALNLCEMIVDLAAKSGEGAP